jgi:hypothetical protein
MIFLWNLWMPLNVPEQLQQKCYLVTLRSSTSKYVNVSSMIKIPGGAQMPPSLQQYLQSPQSDGTFTSDYFVAAVWVTDAGGAGSCARLVK